MTGYLRTLMLLVVMAGTSLAGQTSQLPLASTGTPSNGGNPPGMRSGSSDPASITNGQTAEGRAALTTQQIARVMQEKPEVVVELKQLTATHLQDQGLSIQADAISDEALYNQIASTPSLRVTITHFLRARGYVSDSELPLGNDSETEDNTSLRRSDWQTIPTLPCLQQSPPIASSNARTELVDDAPCLPEDALLQNQRRASTAKPTGMPQQREASTKTQKLTRDVPSNNTTDVPRVLRQPAPYNLLSMRDLYTQIPEDGEALKRFGSEMFLSRTTPSQSRLPLPATQVQMQEAPLDIPIGPSYVVGPGDSLTIELWGGISQTLTRVIDREGRVSLPESGSVQVAGLTLERAQAVIESTLKQQYRNAQVAVTVSRLRTVRVYVTGDVQRPGAYDISSLATPLNAFFAAGGPTAIGSLRTLRHYRGKQLVAEIDLYDFLLHGVRTTDDRFQGGDTLLVPPAGSQVAVSGAVKRPAIYELKTTGNLSEVLDDAGGATVAAALGHITVERIDANQHRETLTLDLTASEAEGNTAKTRAAISSFVVKDGDRIHLAPILPFSERALYLEGHVVRPGRLAYRDGMRLKDVLRSYQDLLPEPAAQGEIVRLVAPDLHAETIQFDVADALLGNVTLELRPFDTIRVRGRYEIDSPRVTIRGEVLRPGVFPLSQGMTAAQLVRMAGGFRRGALQQEAELTSYEIVNGNKVNGQRSSVRIGDAVAHGDATADVLLKPGDILTIHQITGWNDIGASVSIEGEVSHPGNYGFQDGERLSSLLRRAGGFRETAYPEGAVLLRQQVRELEEKSRLELVRQIETSSAAARLSPNLSGTDNSGTLQVIQQQQDQVLARLRSQPASGRLVIHISTDIASWAGTDADVEVRRGDILSIPKRPGFVLVSGQVYNASAITFVPGRSAGWYLQRAGGSSELANKKEIFIIRANGVVVGRHSDAGRVLATELDAGDVVVVPQKIMGASQFWRNLLTTAQIASSVAITAVVAGR